MRLCKCYCKESSYFQTDKPVCISPCQPIIRSQDRVFGLLLFQVGIAYVYYNHLRCYFNVVLQEKLIKCKKNTDVIGTQVDKRAAGRLAGRLQAGTVLVDLSQLLGLLVLICSILPFRFPEVS